MVSVPRAATEQLQAKHQRYAQLSVQQTRTALLALSVRTLALRTRQACRAAHSKATARVWLAMKQACVLRVHLGSGNHRSAKARALRVVQTPTQQLRHPPLSVLVSACLASKVSMACVRRAILPHLSPLCRRQAVCLALRTPSPCIWAASLNRGVCVTTTSVVQQAAPVYAAQTGPSSSASAQPLALCVRAIHTGLSLHCALAIQAGLAQTAHAALVVRLQHTRAWPEITLVCLALATPRAPLLQAHCCNARVCLVIRESTAPHVLRVAQTRSNRFKAPVRAHLALRTLSHSA